MKLKHIINGFWAFSFCLAGCVDPDDLVRTESEITDQLIITGRFAGNENTEYETVIDRANGTAVVQTPYYISDTEPIQGDITVCDSKLHFLWVPVLIPLYRVFTI